LSGARPESIGTRSFTNAGKRETARGATIGSPSLSPPRRRLVVDAERCTGCGCCEMACSLRNYQECSPSRSLIYVARSCEDGVVIATPVTCLQCEDALCVMMCPTEALSRRDTDGTVIADPGRCIGCRTCVEVCPIGAPAVDPRLGTSQKCALCDGDPACVKVCGERALTFAGAEEESLYRRRAAVETYVEHQAFTAQTGGSSRGAGSPA